MKNLTKGIAAVGALAMLTGVGACGSNTADDKGHVYFLNNKPEVVNQWNELAEMYTKQTGVKVDIQSATSGSYESTLSSELAKNNAPTMFGIGGFDSNPHIECSRVTPPPMKHQQHGSITVTRISLGPPSRSVWPRLRMRPPN